MAVDLKGYTALITGGASGMGYQMAKELLGHGATVVIAGRPGPRLDAAEAELKEVGDAYAVALDVSDESSAEAAAKWFFGKFDHLDMLVNNAGIGGNAPGMADLPQGYHFFDIPVSTVEAVLRTNTLGLFNVTSKFAPRMAERGSGTILYTSTSTETMTRPGQLPYGPSKAGAEAMLTIMAGEMAEFGVDVNVICPGGFTDTGMAAKGAKEFFEKNNMTVLQPTVMNRLILFLASDASRGITGEKFLGRTFDEWLEEHGIDFEG